MMAAALASFETRLPTKRLFEKIRSLKADKPSASVGMSGMSWVMLIASSVPTMYLILRSAMLMTLSSLMPEISLTSSVMSLIF